MNNVEEISTVLQHSSLQDQEVEIKLIAEESNEEKGFGNHSGVCAICLDKIKLQEIALVKGCEHAYCVTCILHWATYSKTPNCPQCKHPFDFLNVHRSLDGCIHDYMFEESVCLLLRAQWFTPLSVVENKNACEEVDDYFPYEEDYGDNDGDSDLDEGYYNGSLRIVHIGNRRWGDNGFVRAGRQQARPIGRSSSSQDSGAGSSSQPNRQKEGSKDKTGRRAKRAMKREAADKAAAEKHELRLARLGIK